MLTADDKKSDMLPRYHVVVGEWANILSYFWLFTVFSTIRYKHLTKQEKESILYINRS